MKKFLLTFEFRYMDKPYNEDFSGHTSKTVTIGIYDTIDEAVKAGNDCLTNFKAPDFDARQTDKFKVKGLWGSPDTLVTNTCYSKDKVTYFGKIDTLQFKDLSETIKETFEARKRYEDYKSNQD
ncbi:MAG TPA: hypothetical protein VEA37_09500 [Flavobacterium sp.]|nr:hypothetical protein [Flavobacterium sp.]